MTSITQQLAIKRLAKDLVQDADIAEAMLAIVFLPAGDLKVHGAGLVSSRPELAIYGAARLLFSLLGDYKTESAGGITIEVNASDELNIQATGQANQDPRATLFLIARSLLELTRVIHDMDNLVAAPGPSVVEPYTDSESDVDD